MRGGGAFFEERILIPLASYSGSSSILSDTVKSGAAKRAMMLLYVKTAGTSNLLFRLSAIPFTGSNSYTPGLTVTVTTTGVYVIAWGRGLALQPAGEAAVTTSTAIARATSIPLPDRWRFSVGKGDVSAWEFGVSLRFVP